MGLGIWSIFKHNKTIASANMRANHSELLLMQRVRFYDANWKHLASYKASALSPLLMIVYKMNIMTSK